VLCIAGYSVIAYTLIVCLLLGYWCSPIYEYWAVPYNICVFLGPLPLVPAALAHALGRSPC